MNSTNYVHIIIGVIKDVRVIGTVVAMLLIVEFAKYVTTYKKKAPKPKVKKVSAPKPAPAPEPAAEEEAPPEEE